MGVNGILIWLVILLAAIILLALLSLPGRNFGQKFLMLLVLNFVLHFLNIFFSEFSTHVLSVYLNPFFASNYGPLLWLYFRQFKSRESTITPANFMFFLPSLVFLVWGLAAGFTYGVLTGISIFILMVNFGFVIACTSMYFKKEGAYSLTEKKWLLSLIGLFGILLATAAFNLFFSMTRATRFQDRSITLVFAFAALILVALVYFAIISPEIFSSFKEKYLGSPLSRKESGELALKIETLLRETGLFLEPDISLEKLAAETGTSQKKVSQAINQHLGSNFYDFINSLRVEQASRMLGDPQYAAQPIKYIMYDCGFSNKVSFNKAFKDRTGMTPSEFRNRQVNG